MTSENNLPVFKKDALQPADLPIAAAGLVHEIKNPLAAIHLHLQLLEGYASDIKEEPLKNKIKEKIRYVRSEIGTLNQSLHDFLRLLRAERVEQTTQVDLNRLIQDVVEFIEPQVLREGIDLQFSPGDTEKTVLLDPTFIKQIIMNLILNSIEAFEKSSLPLEKRKIIVTTGEKSDYSYVSVMDNGPGIPAEIREKIFDPFYTTKESGSGLGLAIVKRMVSAMDGHMELYSNPGEGTEFTVYFTHSSDKKKEQL